MLTHGNNAPSISKVCAAEWASTGWCWWEMPSRMGKPSSQLPRAHLSLLKLTSCAWSGMAEHIPPSWAPLIPCVPTTHRLWLAPALQRWEVEACIWFSTPPQEANKVEHRKDVLSRVNITRKNHCSVLNCMEQLEKTWDTKKAVFSVAAQSSECSYN